MIPLWLKALPYLAGAGLLLGVYSYVHHDGYVEGKNDTQQKWDKEKAEQAQAHMQAVVAQQNLDKKREATQHENLAEIDRLRANNHALWLRLPKTTCPPGLPGTTKNPTTTPRVVHTEVSTSTQDIIEAAINEFDRIYSDESLRADRVVEECR